MPVIVSDKGLTAKSIVQLHMGFARLFGAPLFAEVAHEKVLADAVVHVPKTHVIVSFRTNVLKR